MSLNKKKAWRKKGAAVLIGLIILYIIIPIYSAEVDPLTREEREWLKKHGPIKYAPDPNFFPFEFIGSDARAHGITPDILDLISRKLNIEFIYIRCRTWSDVLDSFKQGKVDLLGTITRTKERETFMRFSSPYLNVPVVLFVHKNNPEFANIRNLQGRKVGVVKSYGAEAWLKENYPELKIITVENPFEGLILVETGELDAFVEVLPVGVSLAIENSLLSLRHSQKPLYTTPQHFAVSITNDVLLRIIEKGVAAISDSEKQEIFRKWAKEMPVENSRWVHTILLLAITITLAGLIFWIVINSLKKIIKKQTEKIQKSENFFRGIFENNPLSAAIIDLETGKIIEVNKKFEETSGYNESEIKNRTTIEMGFWLNPSERTMLVENLKKNRVLHGFDQNFRVKGGKIINVVVHGQVFESDGRDVVLYLIEDVTEKKKIESLQKRLADIIESTDAFVLTTDVNLNIFYANASAHKNLSCSRKISDFLTDDARSILTSEIIPHVVKKGSWSGELEIKKKDDETIPTLVIMIAHQKPDNTIDYYSFIFRDISELKKTYAALADREQKLRQIVENSPQVFYVHDTENRVLYVSPQVKEVLGYEIGEIIGRSAKEFISDNPENEVGIELTELAIRTGEKQRPYEIELIRKDGRRIWAEIRESPIVANCKTIAITGSLTDITRRKQAEAQLKERQELLDGIARNSPDLIIIFDIVKQECVYTNKNFAEFLGYKDMPDFSFKDLLNFIHSEDYDKLMEHFSRIRGGEEGKVYEIEYRVKKSDESYIWLEARDSIFKRDESGNVLQILSVQKDITREKQIAKEKEEAIGREHQSKKMASLGELASGVAHDVNNYLTVIKNGLHLLSLRNDLFEHELNCLRLSLNSVEEIEVLSKQLLAFSRKEVMEIKPVSLNDPIRNMVKLFRHTIKENVEIKLNLEENLPLINGDKSMIQSCLMNLARNAQDAMPSGGTITISTKTIDLGSEVILKDPEAKKGRYILIEFSDTGTGISPEIMSKIFEPYFTTKPKGIGTGMGLAIVYGVVKQHGGFVDVESQVGKGTTFKLYFPIPDKLVEVKETITEEKAKLLVGKETILIVEDNEMVRKSAAITLRRFGYNVLEASNGNAALKLVENFNGQIDLLFTDIVLTGSIDGLELARKITEKMPGLKVLYTSGHPGEVLQIKEDLMASGIFLKKPYTPFTLSEKIREILDAGK